MSNTGDGARLFSLLIHATVINEKELRLFCDGMGEVKTLYGELTLTDIIEATENLLQNNNKLIDKTKSKA